MNTLVDPSTINLSLQEQYKDSDAPIGLTGINTNKMTNLKVYLLTTSEEVKKLLLRLEQCRVTIENSVYGEMRSNILKKLNNAKIQLTNFNNNINYYGNALGKVLSAYQNMDDEISETLNNDSELIVMGMEVDNNANNC